MSDSANTELSLGSGLPANAFGFSSRSPPASPASAGFSATCNSSLDLELFDRTVGPGYLQTPAGFAVLVQLTERPLSPASFHCRRTRCIEASGSSRKHQRGREEIKQGALSRGNGFEWSAFRICTLSQPEKQRIIARPSRSPPRSFSYHDTARQPSLAARRWISCGHTRTTQTDTHTWPIPPFRARPQRHRITLSVPVPLAYHNDRSSAIGAAAYPDQLRHCAQ